MSRWRHLLLILAWGNKSIGKLRIYSAVVLNYDNALGMLRPCIIFDVDLWLFWCRSLDDVRLNLEVLKHCATVLFLVCVKLISNFSFWCAITFVNKDSSSMILTRLLWLLGNVRNLVSLAHCIANGMALPALWREAEVMGNRPAKKRQAENLPQLL